MLQLREVEANNEKSLRTGANVDVQRSLQNVSGPCCVARCAHVPAGGDEILSDSM